MYATTPFHRINDGASSKRSIQSNLMTHQAGGAALFNVDTCQLEGGPEGSSNLSCDYASIMLACRQPLCFGYRLAVKHAYSSREKTSELLMYKLRLRDIADFVQSHLQSLPIAWTKHSRASKSAVLPVRIGLNQRNLEHSDRFLDDISNPDSPNFGTHELCTRIGFADIFCRQALVRRAGCEYLRPPSRGFGDDACLARRLWN
jgi:hypothetical protein